MEQLTKQKYWQKAYRRFLLVNWEMPVSQDEIDAFRVSLPPQRENESANDWIKRALTSQFVPFTHIIRRAANSSFEEYPLPDAEDLLTVDDNLRFKIYKEGENIIIKAEALGHAIDDFANCTLALADYEFPDKSVVSIQLNMDGDGEVSISDNLQNRKMLANPVIGRWHD